MTAVCVLSHRWLRLLTATRHAEPAPWTAAQQHAVDQFAKSISTLGDDSLIDAYHQAWEDHRDARPAPPRGAVVRLRGTQIDGPDHPVSTSGISEDRRRAGIELLQQHQVRGEFAQQTPLPFRCLGPAECYIP
jgi:hypothetical protein